MFVWCWLVHMYRCLFVLRGRQKVWRVWVIQLQAYRLLEQLARQWILHALKLSHRWSRSSYQMIWTKTQSLWRHSNKPFMNQRATLSHNPSSFYYSLDYYYYCVCILNATACQCSYLSPYQYTALTETVATTEAVILTCHYFTDLPVIEFDQNSHSNSIYNWLLLRECEYLLRTMHPLCTAMRRIRCGGVFCPCGGCWFQGAVVSWAGYSLQTSTLYASLTGCRVYHSSPFQWYKPEELSFSMSRVLCADYFAIEFSRLWKWIMWTWGNWSLKCGGELTAFTV